MTAVERFIKSVNKLRKQARDTSKADAFDQIHKLFKSAISALPTAATEDLFYYFMKDDADSYPSIDAILDKSHKLEHVISLFDEDLEENEEPFTREEWAYVKETVNEFSGDLPIEQIEYIMSINRIQGDFLIGLIPKHISLAPMAALSHGALRLLIESFGGVDYYYSEMIDSNALCAHTQYEKYYLSTVPDPKKMVFQLLGSEISKMAEGAEILNQTEAIGIDVNMGCSAPPITKKGGGIVWMEDENRSAKLIKELRKKIPNKLLSVKLRIGLKHDLDYLIKFCKALENEGLDFITIHPRTKKEKFKRLSRWEYVQELKNQLSIPVVGNGDVSTFEDYNRKITKYNPQGVMIGRKLVQAPWFAAFLKQRIITPDSTYKVDLFETIQKFHSLLEEHQPSDFWLSRCHRFYSYFHKNIQFGHGLFVALSNIKKYKDLKNHVFEYFEQRPHIWNYEQKD